MDPPSPSSPQELVQCVRRLKDPRVGTHDSLLLLSLSFWGSMARSAIEEIRRRSLNQKGRGRRVTFEAALHNLQHDLVSLSKHDRDNVHREVLSLRAQVLFVEYLRSNQVIIYFYLCTAAGAASPPAPFPGHGLIQAAFIATGVVLWRSGLQRSSTPILGVLWRGWGGSQGLT